MMKQKIIILILISLISLDISAQRRKRIVADIEKANTFFDNGDFEKAIPFYLDILDKKDNNEAAINVAESYRKIGNWLEAEYWYGQIVNFSDIKPIYNLYYGMALQANGKCDLAVEFFNEYTREVPNDHRGQLLANACSPLPPCIKNNDNYEIVPLNINTKDNDYSPVIYQNKLVYTSGYNAIEWTRGCFIDSVTPRLYASQIDTLDENNKEYLYGSPELIFLEEDKKVSASAIFTTDGTKMFFNETEVTNDSFNLLLKLSVMEKTSTSWEETQSFPFNSKEYSIAHPILSSNEDTMYFSSDMPGGFGGMDLYFSVIQDGNWSKPVNLGSRINTEGHEVFPFYHKTGKLYFSSDGQFGSEGLDIFYTRLDDTSSEVIRLPEPINTKYNEHGLILNEAETFGYFSSDRIGGVGEDDIYGVRVIR